MTKSQVCFATVLAGALASSADAFEPRAGAVVRLQGADVETLERTPLDELALLAVRAGRLEPIPFQVDERDPAGRWVATIGPGAGADVDGARLDANDELVFLLGDAGARLEGGPLPPGVERAVELRVDDPWSGQTAWVYLARSGERPPRSPKRYVQLDDETDAIEGESYATSLSRALPSSWAFLALEDGSGGVGPNLVDRLKFRTEADLLMGLVEISLTEEDARWTAPSYAAGPIRVIRQLSYRLRQVLGVESPELTFAHVYNPRSVEVATELRLPVDLGLFLAGLVSTIYLDLRPATDMAFFSTRNPEPVLVDGVMTPAERALERRDPGWLFLRIGGEGLAAHLVVDPRLSPLRADLFYEDDASRDDAPEAVRGLGPGLGFRLTGFEAIPAGTYDLQGSFHFGSDLSLASAARFAEAERHPVEARAVAILDPPR